MILHSCIILFNCFGWIWKKVRIYNLLLLLLTAFSWFILGIWKGWGYCFLTDWHYRVLEKLGYHHLPNSYIQFFIERIFGWNAPEGLVNAATASVFFAALAISLVLNARDWTKKN
jgi:Protein of Unknown function (DUF2784)